MKAVLLLLSLTGGVCAVIRTVDLMNRATAVVDDAMQQVGRR